MKLGLGILFDRPKKHREDRRSLHCVFIAPYIENVNQKITCSDLVLKLVDLCLHPLVFANLDDDNTLKQTINRYYNYHIFRSDVHLYILFNQGQGGVHDLYKREADPRTATTKKALQAMTLVEKILIAVEAAIKDTLTVPQLDRIKNNYFYDKDCRILTPVELTDSLRNNTDSPLIVSNSDRAEETDYNIEFLGDWKIMIPCTPF